MMTPEMLKDGGIQRIVGSGACLIRNQVLQREIMELYKIPVIFVEEGNACIGAAMAIADRYCTINIYEMVSIFRPSGIFNAVQSNLPC